MDYFGGLQAGGMGAGMGAGMDPTMALAQKSSYDPWQLMALVEQSPAMQAQFNMPMPPNMGPQQPAAQGPGLGQLLGMMGGAQPGAFNPAGQVQRPPAVGGAGAIGGARQVAAPNYATGAPTRNVPSLGQLLGRM